MVPFKAYIEYLRDNPEKYWFKRRVFGWGWTPARLQGWITSVFYFGFVLTLAVTASPTASDAAALKEVLVPVGIATIVFVSIVWRTGEPPKWQWGIPKKK